MTGGDYSRKSPRHSYPTSSNGKAGRTASSPTRGTASGSRRSGAPASTTSHGRSPASGAPYSYSATPSAVRSRGAATGTTAGGSGTGRPPSSAPFSWAAGEDDLLYSEDDDNSVPKSVQERDRLRQILNGGPGSAYTSGAGTGTDGASGAWAAAAGEAGEASPPTEQDYSCEVAAPGIILACQDGGGVCDVGMRGVTRLPLSLLKFFRAEGGLVSELRLQGNRLPAAPPLELLPALTLLDLSSNMLKTVPPSVGCLRRLLVLDLSRNHLAGLLPDSLCDLTALTLLDLSHNELQCLPLKMDRMARLVELRLDGNELFCLPPGCAGLPSLTALHASRNHLTALPAELGAASSLTGLFVAHNKLTALPPTIGQLRQRLAELQLHSNHLSVLPRELGRLAALTRITTSSNPLVHPPLEVARKGVAAVREYLLGGWRGAPGQGDGADEAGSAGADGEAEVEEGGEASPAADDGGGPGGQQQRSPPQSPPRGRLSVGPACKACMDKEDRIEELAQQVRLFRDKAQRAERQLDQAREQLGRQAKELAAQATRAVLDAGERARLQRQLEAAALLPGFRNAVPGGAGAGGAAGKAGGGGGGGGGGASAQVVGQEEVEAHLRSELRAAMGAAEVARETAETAERDVRKLRREAEEWEHQFRAERERAEELVAALARERERCNAAVAAATEATHRFEDLRPVVAERDALRKKLEVATGSNVEAWRAADVAREGHLSSEAAADMVLGRLAAMEAAHARLGEQLQRERREAAAAAAEAESRERLLQLQVDRLRADVAAMTAEREALHGVATAGAPPQLPVPSGVPRSAQQGRSAWAPPQVI